MNNEPVSNRVDAETAASPDLAPAAAPTGVPSSVTLAPSGAVPAPHAGEKRKALGRGLESLLPSRPLSQTPAAPLVPAAVQAIIKPEDRVHHLDVDLIDRSPYQTRSEMNKVALAELTESIRVGGVLQPVTVRPSHHNRYQLITGERRLRASQEAGRFTIPAIIRIVPDQVAAEMTVVENLQRADLHPMDQARAFERLSVGFKLTQEEVSKRVGVDRSTVANYLRLLKLSRKTQAYVETGELSFSHAKILAALDDMSLADELGYIAAAEQWSVKRLQEEVEEALHPKPKPAPKPEPVLDPNVKEAQREMERVLGVRVKIKDRNGKGKIVIEYSSLDDFDRVVEILSGE